MAGFGGAVKLTGADDYKKALSQITQNLKVVSAEMKATSSAFDAGERSEKELATASKELNASLNTQKTALANLKNQLSQMSAEYQSNSAKHKELVSQLDNEKSKLAELGRTLGTSSNEYKAQEKAVAQLEQEVKKSASALESEEKALNNMRIQTAKAETTINKTSKSLKDLGDNADDAGKKAKSGSDGFTVMKGILANLGAQVLTACVNGFKNLAHAVGETVSEVGKAGDEIDKSSQKLGVSADTYQELSYAMERSGTNIDVVKKGMTNITKALDGTAKGTAGASSAFDSLGVSMKNADGSMKTSEQVLLDSIDALAGMEDETARNAKSNEIFGRSYQELAPLLNSGSQGIKDLMNEAEQYGMVMSQEAVSASASYEDSLTKLHGTVTGLKNNMVGSFLPALTQVVNGFTELIVGSDDAGAMIEEGINGLVERFRTALPQVTDIITSISETVMAVAPQVLTALGEGLYTVLPSITTMIMDILLQIVSTTIQLLPQIVDAGVQILNGLIQGLTSAIPQLMATIPQVITGIVTAITSNLPMIIQSGLQLISALANGLISAVPQLVAQIPTIITSIVTAILQAIPTIIQTGTQILIGLLNGILTAIPQMVAQLPQIISAIVSTLISNIPLIIQAGVQLLVALVQNLPAIIAGVVSAVPSIIKALYEGFVSGVGQMADAGLNLIKGLWEGIKNAKDWVLGKIKSFGEDILNGLKEFFGIHSPSKVMESVIGKNIALGVAEGVTKNTKYAKKSADEMGKAVVSSAKSRLSELKKANQISAKEEVDYWQTIADSVKKGSDAYNTAMANLTESKNNLEKSMASLAKTYEEGVKKANEELNKGIEDLQNSYNDTIFKRADEITGSLNLFDAVKLDDAISKTDLTNNLRSQVDALSEWESTWESLKGRIHLDELYEELQKQGVNSLNVLKSLNSMSEAELDEYENLYLEKMRIAEDRARSENIGLESYTNEQIAELKRNASEKIGELNKAYVEGLNGLGVDGSKESLNIGTQVSTGIDAGFTDGMKVAGQNAQTTVNGFISTIKDTVTASQGAVEAGQAIAQNVSNLDVSGAGKSVTDGLGGGIASGGTAVLDATQEIINSMIATIKKSVKTFAEVGTQLTKDLLKGFISGKNALVNASTETAESMFNSLQRYESDFEEIGEYLADGLRDGFLSQEGRITNAVVGMMRRIVREAREEMDINSPSKVWAEIGSYMAQGLDVGFVGQMKNVTADINGSLPTSINSSIGSNTGGFDSMVSAFKEALTQVKIEMDDEEMGHFVDKTVTRLIYT